VALPLYVVATTDKGTLAALNAARSLSSGLSSTITLLVPHIVPYPQALDQPLVPVSFSIARFAKLSAAIDTELSLRICVCRPGEFRFDAVLPTDVVVLVGGARGLLRRTREQRLVDRLTARGRRALFVDH
jgi:hypothetical protein